jgi:hypothetical protein
MIASLYIFVRSVDSYHDDGAGDVNSRDDWLFRDVLVLVIGMSIAQHLLGTFKTRARNPNHLNIDFCV